MAEGRKFGTRARAWPLALAFALLPAVVPDASAAASPRRLALADVSDEARLAAAAADLQLQLQRKTEEISELKRRSQRGLRADYDLRQRMAEANDLARQLTALENQLRQVRGRRPAAAPTTAPAVVEPAAALEARADLLSDEARKLADRAAGMVRAAGQLRTRQTLRRRAVAVDRDPFAVLDGSKRLVLGSRQSRDLKAPSSGQPETTAGGPGVGNPTPTSGPEMAGQPVQPTPPGNSPPPANPMPANPMITPPPGATPPPMPPPTAPGSAPAPMDPAPPTTTTPAPDGAERPNTLSQPGGATTTSQLAPGSLLDPALRAELQRLERGAVGAGDVAALERAAAALSARAKALESEAKALRARAATH